MANKTNEQILAGAKADAQWGTAAGVMSALSSLYSGFMGMKTAKTYGRMQQRAAETQARLNEIATERNIGYQTRQTADAISDIQRQGRQVLGSQLAINAATGGSTASGSMQALMRSTGYSVGRDISTLQANLINSAYEQRRQTKIENIGLQYQGAMARLTGRSEGFNQLAQGVAGAMSSAMSVAQKWQRLDDLTMLSSAQQPAIEGGYVGSPAYTRSKLDLFNYSTYPSMTGLETDLTNLNSPLNQLNQRLELSLNKRPIRYWGKR
jgi:hypothetical protein